MLKNMCHKLLNAADIKAICKSRGFASGADTSRTILESIFLSDMGLADALASLTHDEILILHLLKLKGQDVNVAFFEPIYGKKDSSQKSDKWHLYESFTEKYKEVFKQVKSSLIRKGVLLMGESQDTWNTKTRMERWRFRFPHEFERFLGSPFNKIKNFDVSGDFKKQVIRNKIMEVVKEISTLSLKNEGEYSLKINNGELCIGDRRFSTGYLKEWQESCWEASVLSEEKYKKWAISPVKAVIYILSQLKQNELSSANELDPALNIFCYGGKIPASEFVCEKGWEWGCLVKHTEEQKTYYGLVQSYDSSEADSKSYLTVNAQGSVIISLEFVPYESLELLAQISTVKVMDSQLLASPNFIKIGNAAKAVWENSLF
ncbi:MAG: hypothetical protein ABIA63_08890, partial [bacterium]